MKEIVKFLYENGFTVSTMESCTGGYLSSSITNVSGSSNVFSFGAVTYSDNQKINMGVNKTTIEKYGVYSNEVSKEMARIISMYTSSTFGVGITGTLSEEKNYVYFTIYDSRIDKYYDKKLQLSLKLREINKQKIIDEIVKLFKNIFEI